MINEIILGDAHQLIEEVPDNSIHAIITDPPYGGGILSGDVDWGIIRWEEIFPHFDRVLVDDGYLFIFGMVSFYCRLYEHFKNFFRIYFDLIWVKPNIVNFHRSKRKPLTKHEIILCLIKHKANMSQATYNFKEIGEEGEISYSRRCDTRSTAKLFKRLGDRPSISNVWFRYPSSVIECYNRTTMPFEERYPHPTQKPLLLCEKLVIGFTGEGDTVLDPFAGSGTIPLAAAKHKRNFIGFEINERYVRMGRERIDFEMKQLSFM